MGIDFHQGLHQARCLDERAQLCDGFSFRTTLQCLTTLEERIFRDGSTPIVVFEPMGLAWLIVAAYLRARHPGCRLVKAKGQKVAALRRYLRGSAKSDRIDAITLAKMPFIDPEQLAEVYLPPAEVCALQRLTRQRQRLEGEVVARKNRIGRIVDGYLPGVREAFSSPWSPQARAFLRSQLDPFAVVRAGEEALHTLLARARSRSKTGTVETQLVYQACQNVATLYELSRSSGVDEGFFADLQEEIARELRLMEAEEAEAEALSLRIEELYQKLHPQDNLRTIPGVGEHTAPVFLAVWETRRASAARPPLPSRGGPGSQAIIRCGSQEAEDDQSRTANHQVGPLSGGANRPPLRPPACLGLLPGDGPPRQEP